MNALQRNHRGIVKKLSNIHKEKAYLEYRNKKPTESYDLYKHVRNEADKAME